MPDKSKLEETHLKETWIEKDFEMFFSEKIRSTELPNLERMNCKFNLFTYTSAFFRLKNLLKTGGF